MKKPNFLDIHFEGMDDNGAKLREILDRDIPCALSIAPYTFRKGWYDDDVLGLAYDAVRREGSVLGQQGNMHKCKHKHRFVDPWHENHCLYGWSLSKDEQRELIEKGRETLKKRLGVNPEMYVPPNHQFNMATLDVAIQMKYKVFAIRGLKTSEPLTYANVHGPIVVLPEVKLSNDGTTHYVHYDEIENQREQYEKALESVIPFSGIRVNFPENGSPNRNSIIRRMLDDDLRDIKRNLGATNRRKFLRDVWRFPARFFGRLE